MVSKKTPFVHKLLDRLDRLDRGSIETYLRGLAEKNVLQNEILENLLEGILLLSPDGKIYYANHQAQLWLGIDSLGDKPQGISKIIEDTKLKTFLTDHLDSPDERHVGDFTLLTPREISIRAYLIPLEQSSESLKLMIMQDVSSLRLEGKDENLARIEALVSLAAGIAHEIGNPLNSLGIHLQILKKQITSLPESKKEAFLKPLKVLEGETQRLDKIIRNFLKATRKPPLRFKTDNLNQTLNSALDFMKPELKENHIQATFKQDKALPAFMFDRERLYQAFLNLIKNAMEAMPEGGKLSIQISHKDKIALIRFKDEGEGIDEKDLPHIFEAYYTTKEEGSGLGLMTVYNAIREHGGRIEVASKPSQGTTFNLMLPIRQPKLQITQIKK